MGKQMCSRNINYGSPSTRLRIHIFGKETHMTEGLLNEPSGLFANVQRSRSVGTVVAGRVKVAGMKSLEDRCFLEIAQNPRNSLDTGRVSDYCCSENPLKLDSLHRMIGKTLFLF